MNWKRRRYLMTGKNDNHWGDAYAVQQRTEAKEWESIHQFFTPSERAIWIAESPLTRKAVGKRHPAVKAFRSREAGGRHART